MSQSAKADAAAGDRKPIEGRVAVRVGEKGYRADVTLGEHALVADEPKSMGVEDVGPNPYDLLLASVGTCKAMTLRMYADRKGWYLGGVEVRLTHRRIHAKDCAECEADAGRVEVIDAEIELHGDLSDEQRERLLEIADRCPVHKTITSDLTIRTKIADSE
ncbi:MAG: OsmC family peroxiredoxin [Phycisphaerales bacterium]|nr:MAG: OsmC family peroxiredoxin [Phycisphaerales bacterium]